MILFLLACALIFWIFQAMLVAADAVSLLFLVILCTLARQEKLEGGIHASAWLWGRLDHVRIQIVANCQFDFVSRLADLTCLTPMLFTVIPVPVWKALFFYSKNWMRSAFLWLRFTALPRWIGSDVWICDRVPITFPFGYRYLGHGAKSYVSTCQHDAAGRIFGFVWRGLLFRWLQSESRH